MKRVFEHPPASPTDRRYWRSPAELQDTPEFKEALAREFPAGAAELEMDGLSRRSFLKLMGASTALAGLGLAACRRPEHKLLPFAKSAEWTIPGKYLFYATSMPRAGGAIPLIVTTFDGRPLKVDGNRDLPGTNGGTDMQTQASVLELYDPDRASHFIQAGQQTDQDAFETYLDTVLTRHEGDGGAGLALLLEESSSPTRERLRKRLQERFPQALWAVYEPGSLLSATVSEAAFGEGVQVGLNLANADVLLTLDCDLLGTEDVSGRYQADFARRRRVDQEGGAKMNRLYTVENHYTVTGGMADHRLRIPASHVGEFTRQLAEELGVSTGGLEAAPGVTFPDGWVREVARDLKAAGGRALVIAGPRQPVAVQLLALSINESFGGLGQTIEGSQNATSPSASITELARQIAGKRITTLFVIGGNPVYNAPADLNWAELQKTIPDVVRFGLYYDETTALSRWHVPAAHYLESWGDGLAADGSYLPMQPMILPLYDGWSEQTMLSVLAGEGKQVGPVHVQDTFREMTGTSGFAFEEAWNQLLRLGFLENSESAPRALSRAGGRGGETAAVPPLAPAGSDAIEVVLVPDYRVGDGRYANLSWLQEGPDPVTKLTWDNAALMNLQLAERFGITAPNGKLGGVREGDVIQLEVAGRSIEIPVLISPGHADNSITIPLGYGRRMLGSVASGAGVDAYPLLVSNSPFILTGAKISKTGRSYPLGLTQDHWSMEGRAFIREGTRETYEENPEFAQKMWLDSHSPEREMPSLYANPPLDGAEQWGMAIDLNTCTGCNACVIACQAENNIPVVGKAQVMNGREMHWIRLDRYYASAEGHEQEPEMITQPVMCQHCENAPCETVCPVNATVHNNEGLNVMAYNRCIGTRYCANNCPFKVRRFNFFDYNERPIAEMKLGPLKAQGLYFGPLTEKGMPDSQKLQKNPNVTVRMRGVMEKCTFCVQRIEEAKIAAKVKAGPSPRTGVPVDSFQVACQQVCASEAIIFGDLNHPESKISKAKNDPRNYRLLDYLLVKARVSYLARIRNLNQAMPGVQEPAAYFPPHGGEPAGHAPATAPHEEVGA